MAALEIRKDRTPTMLRKLAKATDDARMARRILAIANALDDMRRDDAARKHVTMVLDLAGWHGAKALAVPSNITLIPLPPYAPQLKPVERVWLYLKERFLSHRLLADDNAVSDAATQAWSRLVAKTSRITCALLVPRDSTSQMNGGAPSNKLSI